MRKRFLIPFIIFCGSCCEMKDEVIVNAPEVDRKFMTAAAYRSLYAVDAGYLSVQNAGDSAVKTFGRTTADDNLKAGKELSDIAAYFDYSLPLSPDSTHEVQKRLLMNASGRAFDSLFIVYQIKDLKETITLYEDRLKADVSTLLESYTKKYLPMIRGHLEYAESVKKQIKIDE